MALLSDVVLPSGGDLASHEVLPRVAVKTMLALAAFIVASRALAPVELAEARPGPAGGLPAAPTPAGKLTACRPPS